MDVVEVVLAPEDGSDHQLEIAAALVDLAQLGKVGHRQTQRAPGLEHTQPLDEHALDVAPAEVLEHVAVVDQIDRVVADESQIVDRCNMVDMGVVHRVDVHEAGDMPLAAAEMEFHGVGCSFASGGGSMRKSCRMPRTSVLQKWA